MFKAHIHLHMYQGEQPKENTMNTYTNTLIEARELRAGAWTNRPGKKYPAQVVRVTRSCLSPLTGRMVKARFYFDYALGTKNYDEHYLDSLVSNL